MSKLDNLRPKDTSVQVIWWPWRWTVLIYRVPSRPHPFLYWGFVFGPFEIRFFKKRG